MQKAAILFLFIYYVQGDIALPHQNYSFSLKNAIF